MSEKTTHISDVQAALDSLTNHYPETTYSVAPTGACKNPAPVAVISAGRTPKDLLDYLEKFNGNPMRARGTSNHSTEDSFCEHVKRYKIDENSVLFANPEKPLITAIYNYHAATDVENGKPGFADFVAKYSPQFSREWESWSKVNEVSMGQDALGQFMEDNAFDIMSELPDPMSDTLLRIGQVINTAYATADQVLDMSRSFVASDNVMIRETRTSMTGDKIVEYQQKGSTEQTTGAFRGLFLISIPVFLDGPKHTMAVRIRYRKKTSDGGQGHTWSYSIYRLQQNLDLAYKEILNRIATDTNVQMFIGNV